MSEMSTDHDAKSQSAYEALRETAAEMSVQTMSDRRWMFLFFAALFGIGFPVIAISLFVKQSDISFHLFGLVIGAAGLFFGYLMVNAYRKSGKFIDAYEEKVGKTRP
ncbi:MAG: hypothetical protein AAGC95_00485 [Pseudomonadota bacterium]